MGTIQITDTINVNFAPDKYYALLLNSILVKWMYYNKSDGSNTEYYQWPLFNIGGGSMNLNWMSALHPRWVNKLGGSYQIDSHSGNFDSDGNANCYFTFQYKVPNKYNNGFTVKNLYKTTLHYLITCPFHEFKETEAGSPKMTGIKWTYDTDCNDEEIFGPGKTRQVGDDVPIGELYIKPSSLFVGKHF